LFPDFERKKKKSGYRERERRVGQLRGFISSEPGEREKLDSWQDEIERVSKSLLVWWKQFYRIPSSDVRFIHLTYEQLYEDYVEYLILSDDSIDDDKDFRKWKNEVFADPESFQEWAEKQKEKIQQVNRQLGASKK